MKNANLSSLAIRAVVKTLNASTAVALLISVGFFFLPFHIKGQGIYYGGGGARHGYEAVMQYRSAEAASAMMAKCAHIIPYDIHVGFKTAVIEVYRRHGIDKPVEIATPEEYAAKAAEDGCQEQAKERAK